MNETRGAEQWRRLQQAIEAEIAEIRGFGSVTLRLIVVDGLPVQIDTIERRTTRRLDRDQSWAPAVDGTRVRA